MCSQLFFFILTFLFQLCNSTDNTIHYAVPGDVLTACKASHFQLDVNLLQDWNAHIRALAEMDEVVGALEKLCYYRNDEQTFRDVLV